MKGKGFILSAWLLVLAACGPAREPFDMEQFRSPGVTFRSATFYSLNDSLSSDRIRSQIRSMKQAGFGGVFLHSRPGLLTPYLGEEWFRMMEAGVDECRAQGMEVWFYDEDKWPSGFAGGIVPRQDDAFRARTLVRRPSGMDVSAPDSLLQDDGKWQWVSHVDPMGQSWYNGTCWVDLMNPGTVQAFLDCTYQPYFDRFRGVKCAKGFFSDEPQVSPRTDLAGGDAYIAYSPVMEESFRQMWGYDMDSRLNELVDTVGDWRLFRLHYYRTVAACMENAFSRPMARACADNGFVWTGHFNAEENPSSTMKNEGNLSVQLRHLQVPGVDALGLRFKEFHNGKIMTSVANQYGRRRRVVEIFGIAGHNLSFEDRLWLTAWHTLCGMNMLCPHLSLYSAKGSRKRDYPPTFSHHEPYWSQNALYEDAAARLCYFAMAGRPVGEVCVLSPLESDYITTDVRTYTNGASPSDRLMERIFGLLAASQLNYDLGDEQIIADVGAVRNGRFCIGEMAYHTVILPGMLTLRPTTLSLLEAFADAGGRVLVCGGWPSMLEGAPADFAGLRSRASFVDEEALPAALRSLPRTFTLEGDGLEHIWTHLREVSGGHTLQLSNMSRHRSVRVKVVPGGKAVLLNPLDGEALQPPCGPDGSFVLDFAPAQTWILAVGKKLPAAGKPYRLPSDERSLLCTLDGEWTLERRSPNALPLDFAEWSTDGGATWQGPEPVLAIYQRSEHPPLYDGPMLLRYGFCVGDLPVRCSLAVEQPWMYKEITLNGKPLPYGKDFFIDEDFRLGDVAALLRQGENEVELSLDYRSPRVASFFASERYGTEIETLYLCGDFGVQGRPAADQPVETWRNRVPILSPKPLPTRYERTSLKLVAESPVLSSFDLTRSVYPFFAGTMTCRTQFTLDCLPDRPCLLSFGAAEAILVDVEVNGQRFPTVWCSPWETDITSALRPGNNEVAITLTNGLRNLMGPYHHKGGEFSMIGPAHFNGADSWPNWEKGDNDWYERRKEGRTLLWRDDYYCIPFGLMEAPRLLMAGEVPPPGSD